MSSIKPKTLAFISAVLILFGLFWFVTTVIPVIWVETKFQYHSILENTFHVTDIRLLIIPDFKGVFDFRGQSKYQDYGIVIPGLYIDEPVVFNVDPNDEISYRAALKKGIAHASSTAFPDNPGVGYYFAHSSTPEFKNQYNAIFYLLGKLKTGDEVFIWHEGKRYEYRVFDQKITSPDDLSFLNLNEEQKTAGQEIIVLQTCWPPGTTSRRMLVFAVRVK